MKIINTLTIGGLILIGTSVIQFLFPPKFGALFGLKTKLTLKSAGAWLYGQKVFNLLLLLFGTLIISAGLLNYSTTLKFLAPFGFIAFSFIAKYIADQLILKKFPDLM